MKKVLALAALLAAVSLTSMAAPLCTTVTLASLLTQGASCEVSDKIFSNFSYTGDIAAANVSVQFTSNGAVPAGASVQFTPTAGSWSNLSNLSYTVSIDTTICQYCQFVAVLDRIFTNPTPNSVTGTFTHNPGGSANVNGSAPGNLSAQVNLATPNPVVSSFSQTGGTTLQGVSSSYSQVLTPEPMTMSLMGAGLLAVGLFGRRFRRQ